MAVLIDDPIIIESVRKLAAQMKCSEEEAIRHTSTVELKLLKERPRSVLTSQSTPCGVPSQDRAEGQ